MDIDKDHSCMREGKWTNYFPNGQLHAKTFFVKNKKHGAYEEFNKFGKRTAIGGDQY